MVLRGYASALAAAAFVGTVNVASKFALDAGAHPLQLSAAAYLVAALVLSPFLLRFRLHAPRDAWRIAAIIAAGGVLAPLALFYGLQRTTAVTASLLVNMEILFTTLLAFTILRERFRGREAAALGVIFAGGLTVTLGPDLAAGTRPAAENLIGVGLVTLAAFGWSIENTLSTPLSRRYALRPLLAVKVLGGALVITAASLAVTGGVTPPRDVWGPVAYNGTVGIVAAVLCFFYALRTVGATRTVVLFSSAGLWGALGGWLVLAETLTVPHLAGGGVMIVGVAWLARLAPREATPRHVPPGP